MALTGPTSNLPGRARRRGRSGTVLDAAGQTLGQVTAVEFDVEMEQIDVPIAGTWRNEIIPGVETRRGTFRYQDVDDSFKLIVFKYMKARAAGDRTALPPVFNLTVKIDDAHAPQATTWFLGGCQLFTYSGGYSMDDDLLVREVPFSFQTDYPISAFSYDGSAAGITPYSGI